MGRKRRFGLSDIIVILIVVVLVVVIFSQLFGSNNRQETISVNDFYERLENQSIEEITFSGEKGEGKCDGGGKKGDWIIGNDNECNGCRRGVACEGNGDAYWKFLR